MRNAVNLALRMKETVHFWVYTYFFSNINRSVGLSVCLYHANVGGGVKR
jgi:hypothetical protein